MPKQLVVKDCKASTLSRETGGEMWKGQGWRPRGGALFVSRPCNSPRSLLSSGWSSLC